MQPIAPFLLDCALQMIHMIAFKHHSSSLMIVKLVPNLHGDG
jgi:hypothetical protein